MAVIIPNSTDTTGGEEYSSLDQAEPDSLDFEIAGNTGSNGVLSGCVVSSNGSSSNVAVSAGTVVIGGLSYAVAANASLALPVAPTDSRFDVVVARVSGSTASLVVVKGVESSTNPLHPQSMSVYGGAYDGSIHIDFSTDTVLASCLRVASATVTSKEIVDKRAMVSSTIRWRGTTLPASAPDGTTFHLTNEITTGVGVVASGLYFRANGAWVSIAQNNQYLGAPIGSTIWFNGTSAPAGHLVENGASYATADYPELFAVIGYTFGGSGANFNVPDTLGRMVRGGTTPGTKSGSDTVALTLGNLPQHSHSMAHTHTLVHHHSIAHNHDSATTSNDGSHFHGPFSTWDGYLFVKNGSDSFFGSVEVATSTTSGRYVFALSAPGPTDQQAHADRTGTASAHNHTVNLPSITANSGGASQTTTSGSSESSTGNAGSGSAFSNLPAYISKLPCIKAS